MTTLTANEAKTHFGELLLKAQQQPVTINKNGKPVAVVMSVDEYEQIEQLKLQYLKARAAQAQIDITENNLIDGEAYFAKLLSSAD